MTLPYYVPGAQLRLGRSVHYFPLRSILLEQSADSLIMGLRREVFHVRYGILGLSIADG
ncbi:MAG: hypothetical protein ACJARL_003336 [Halopseudomonas sp.]|jgi:hypothetical protein